MKRSKKNSKWSSKIKNLVRNSIFNQWKNFGRKTRERKFLEKEKRILKKKGKWRGNVSDGKNEEKQSKICGEEEKNLGLQGMIKGILRYDILKKKLKGDDWIVKKWSIIEGTFGGVGKKGKKRKTIEKKCPVFEFFPFFFPKKITFLQLITSTKM